MLICLLSLQLGLGLGVIGAVYLPLSGPYVISSIVVGKLTDVLVRVLHNIISNGIYIRLFTSEKFVKCNHSIPLWGFSSGIFFCLKKAIDVDCWLGVTIRTAPCNQCG